jgi:serine/threonine protein kinase
LKDRKIFHNDIKPGNILIDFYDNIRICDFGLSTRLDNNGQDNRDFICGTTGFRAPEYIVSKAKDYYAVDMWSVGIIFLSMLTYVNPFLCLKDRNIKKELFNIFKFL